MRDLRDYPFELTYMVASGVMLSTQRECFSTLRELDAAAAAAAARQDVRDVEKWHWTREKFS